MEAARHIPGRYSRQIAVDGTADATTSRSIDINTSVLDKPGYGYFQLFVCEADLVQPVHISKMMVKDGGCGDKHDTVVVRTVRFRSIHCDVNSPLP